MFETILVAGTLIDRYGDTRGKFAAPYQTPFYQRSLPWPETSYMYSVYLVKQNVHVKVGHAMGWFGYVGCGVQYKFFESIEELIDKGVLEQV